MKNSFIFLFLLLLNWPSRGGEETGAGIFVPGRVAAVHLSMTEEDLEKMMSTAAIRSFEVEHEYVPAEMEFDGELISGVAVRIKGNSSRVNSAGQPSLKVDFNRFNPRQEFDGLTKLNFHNQSSRLADFLSYGAWRDFGTPAPRTGWADVWINGGFFEFFTTVEQVDQRFLSRHFKSDGGNLYKGEGDSGDLVWRGSTIEDYPSIGVKRQPGADHASFLRLIKVVNHQPVSAFNDVLDLRGVLTYFAGNPALGNYDDYAGAGHNYYLYENSPGQFTLLPWDMNSSQTQFGVVIRGLRPNLPLSNKLLGDPLYSQLYLSLIKAFIDGPGSPQVLNQRIDDAVNVLTNRLNAGVIRFLREDIDRRIASLREQLQKHLTNTPTPRIFINEIMASNSKTLADEHGAFQDWIELYNPNEGAADLSGMFLTDDPTNTRKWQFPENSFIAGNGFLLLWASGDPEGGPLHTNFRFSKAGEYAGLYDTEERLNLLIDGIEFGPQERDVSEGRLPDGGSFWVKQRKPTPGKANDMTDSDADGMPDAWELHFGLDPYSRFDADLDLDGDGISNRDEFLMGTNPADPCSAFKISHGMIVGNRFKLMWKTEPGWDYQVQTTTNLLQKVIVILGRRN